MRLVILIGVLSVHDGGSSTQSPAHPRRLGHLTALPKSRLPVVAAAAADRASSFSAVSRWAHPSLSWPHVASRDAHMASAKTKCEPGGLSEFVTTNSGVQMPRLLYKTAHRSQEEKESTEDRVFTAMNAGYRGLDTAAWTQYYDEPGVGRALTRVLGQHNGRAVDRDGLFIQTKVNLQHAAEMNPDVPLKKQVELSIANSLSDLGVDYVDSLLLHGPHPHHPQTMEAWHAMEGAMSAGLARQLGVANVDMEQLLRIHTDATVKPAVVYQRVPGWKRIRQLQEMREWCAEAGVLFQQVGLPYPNLFPISSPKMNALAAKYDTTPPMLFFRYLLGLGIIPLISLGDVHKGMYLKAARLPLGRKDAQIIEELLERSESWKKKKDADSSIKTWIPSAVNPERWTEETDGELAQLIRARVDAGHDLNSTEHWTADTDKELARVVREVNLESLNIVNRRLAWLKELEGELKDGESYVVSGTLLRRLKQEAQEAMMSGRRYEPGEADELRWRMKVLSNEKYFSLEKSRKIEKYLKAERKQLSRWTNSPVSQRVDEQVEELVPELIAQVAPGAVSVVIAIAVLLGVCASGASVGLSWLRRATRRVDDEPLLAPAFAFA